MPYARTKAARLRELRRLTAKIAAAEIPYRTLLATRDALILDNERAEDKATSVEVGEACGEGFQAAAYRARLKTMRDRR